MQLPFTLSHETDAPSSPADSVLYATHAPAWESGVKGDARTLTPGSDNGILTIVIMLLVLVALNMGHIRRLFRNIDSDLFSLRRRQNLFDDHTAKESRTILTLLLQLCVFEGILLFLWLQTRRHTVSSGGGPHGACIPLPFVSARLLHTPCLCLFRQFRAYAVAPQPQRLVGASRDESDCAHTGVALLSGQHGLHASVGFRAVRNCTNHIYNQGL